jgi:cytochrome P450
MLPMASNVSRSGISSSDIAQLLKKQISDLTDDPEKLKQLPHNMTIYHRLMDPKAFRDGTVPSAGSLYEEGQALMFGGGDTVGNTLMVGIHHLLQQPATLRTLKEELSAAWPTISHEPTLSELEKLPYLNAVIKESLRMSSGVVSGLLRMTPSAGATVNGVTVPPQVNLSFGARYLYMLIKLQTIVSCGSTFVHYNASIFPEPTEFRPERWIASDELDNWLVAFSRGPRMCLGIK